MVRRPPREQETRGSNLPLPHQCLLLGCLSSQQIARITVCGLFRLGKEKQKILESLDSKFNLWNKPTPQARAAHVGVKVVVE